MNLDYRSLFLHFENNSLFYRGSIVARVKEDFLATQSQCRAVEACDMKRYSRRWIVDGVLRIFARCADGTCPPRAMLYNRGENFTGIRRN